MAAPSNSGDWQSKECWKQWFGFGRTRMESGEGRDGFDEEKGRS